MNSSKEESDSDVEVLNPRTLRSAYFRQQMKLINSIKDIHKKIPKKWEFFKEFVDTNVTWHPSVNLVRSVWKKLYLAEDEFSDKPLQVIELSDEDPSEDCCIVSVTPSVKCAPEVIRISESAFKQKPTALIEPTIKTASARGSFTPPQPADIPNTRKRKSSTKSSKSCSKSEEQSEIVICINDEHSPEEIVKVADNSTSEKIPKTKRKKRKKSTMNAEEAEALRQILLIDKLIELNLPTVLESVMGNCPPPLLESLSSNVATTPTVRKQKIKKS